MENASFAFYLIEFVNTNLIRYFRNRRPIRDDLTFEYKLKARANGFLNSGLQKGWVGENASTSFKAIIILTFSFSSIQFKIMFLSDFIGRLLFFNNPPTILC